ncbi:hypothetical protein [Anaerostipes hadrus]|uniref:hypothetical protein n=1 Tax=Anaerostipes hadrus TaxID=649756 RepID=UPI0034A183B1
MVNKKIQLDFTEEGLREKIEVVQGDTGRVLICNIIGVDMTNVSARFYAVKKSGKEIYNNCTVSQNTVTIELTEQTLAEVGIVKCQLDLRKGNQKVQSFIFDIDVTASLMAQSEYLSSDEYKVVDDLADKVEKNENKIAELDDKKANKDDYGSPLQAKTVAEMTDKKKVYVYVGTETGYINGNWYTWKETAWVSGGVYNSAAIQTDKTLTQSDKAADSAIVGQQIGELKESISDLQGPGSGLNNAAKNILLNILKNAIYTTDQVNNINELGKTLAGDVYSITNNLTHCTSSNTELSVAKGNSYTTTIIADSKYVINSCRVTMKGIDITDSVYSNGKITINSVTGNVVITVVAEKGTDNLIKKSQCTSGNLGNGASADGSTAFITPFIEVEPSTVYKHNITTTLSDGSKAYNQYFELYDANKTLLNTTQINTGGAAYESITEYTNNASTHYIRILFNADHKNPYFGKSGEF